jgi:hypothetical protein
MKKEQMPLRPSLTELSDKMQRTTRANAMTMLRLDAKRLNEINITKPIAKQKWKHAIVTVGGGRGFIVEGKAGLGRFPRLLGSVQIVGGVRRALEIL